MALRGDLRPQGETYGSKGGPTTPRGELQPQGGTYRPQGGDLQPLGWTYRPQGGTYRGVGPQEGDVQFKKAFVSFLF
ncbi:hypothetical protein L484_017570 [Morus notabilis]|uniref:Uncharacterized protein n=1 Tax=Morus notabilis TaxID=981085 RepID=W9R033_9ROSA|nr:hypothetical protein L484_017570 [Morus notabilis]